MRMEVVSWPANKKLLTWSAVLCSTLGLRTPVSLSAKARTERSFVSLGSELWAPLIWANLSMMHCLIALSALYAEIRLLIITGTFSHSHNRPVSENVVTRSRKCRTMSFPPDGDCAWQSRLVTMVPMMSKVRFVHKGSMSKSSPDLTKASSLVMKVEVFSSIWGRSVRRCWGAKPGLKRLRSDFHVEP